MAKGRKPRKLNTSTCMEYWEEESNLLRITDWFMDGLTVKEVAENKMGISEATFYRWKSNSEKMQKAVEEGKKPVDIMVKNALLKRCIGYDVTEGRINEKGEKVMVQRHIPPDPSSIRYWLNNRDPKNWSFQQNIEVTGELPVIIKDDIQE